MTLASGFRLGPYEILVPIGAGGMGEVYKAKDTRLDREVAVKVLPTHLSDDPELKARFEREARAISHLTHPHICTLYDVGNHEGVEFLVMEFLEGESLADRLTRGALSAEQVLKIGAEIADALEAAHRQGIVHRDLKPGNVMLTKSGVKLLDFGLAKHRAAATASGIADLSSLPTEASPSQPLTERGAILGTFQYMAPEQLEGREIDARTDIFALGCLLYEMATGRKAFTGRSRASLIGSILKEEPPAISSIQSMTPPALDHVVRRCLAKEPDDRWQSAADVAAELRWIVEAGSQPGMFGAVRPRRTSRERIAWALFAMAIALGGVFALVDLRRMPRDAGPIRASIVPPERLFVRELALSPDGKVIALTAGKPGGRGALWIQPLAAEAARPVPGAEEAGFPFWSPDSRFVGFFGGGKLKKVEFDGGPVVTICDAANGVGGTWNRGGTIVFAATPTSPLYRVSSSGGDVSPVTKLSDSRHETSHRYPYFLPDGRHFLYTAANFSGSVGDPANAIRVAALDGGGDEAIVHTVSLAVYAAGNILYGRDGTLFSQRFDTTRLRTEGDAVPLAQHVGGNGWAGYWAVAASERLLICASEYLASSQLQWFDRKGRLDGQVGETGLYASPRLSPDGRRVAVDVFDPSKHDDDVWLFDLSTGTGRKVVFDKWHVSGPVWSPDGNRITFASTPDSRGGHREIWIKSIDGAAEEAFARSVDDRMPEDWSRDGNSISFRQLQPKGNRNPQVWTVSLPGGNDAAPVAAGAASYGDSRFSPDGRWLAFDSDESGRLEVYVSDRRGAGGKQQVSTAGGSMPAWKADGRELYYLSLDAKIMAVPVTAAAGFHAGAPVALFGIHPLPFGTVFDVTADGRRFLVDSASSDRDSPSLTLVVNWTGLLGHRS